MEAGARVCPKCDARLGAQSDGSSVTVDIAHHRETVAQALTALRAAVSRARKTPARELRVIVGRGEIRDAAAAALEAMRASGAVRAVAFAPRNPGEIRVTLKRRT